LDDPDFLSVTCIWAIDGHFLSISAISYRLLRNQTLYQMLAKSNNPRGVIAI